MPVTAPDRVKMLRELAARIASLELPHPLRVAIDGTSAAGKSTLTDELAGLLNPGKREVIRVSVDEFHHSHVLRYRRGRLSPEGYYFDGFDYNALRSEVLLPLGPAGSRRYRTGVRDVRSDQLLERPQIQAADDAIVLIDGIFLMRPEIDDQWDLRIFVRVTEAAA